MYRLRQTYSYVTCGVTAALKASLEPLWKHEVEKSQDS